MCIRDRCDVTNPLYGPNGAAVVYAPQKGATPEMVKLLNEQLIQFDHILQTQLGYSVAALPGAGAAGGFGAGAVAFLPVSYTHLKYTLEVIGFTCLVFSGCKFATNACCKDSANNLLEAFFSP